MPRLDRAFAALLAVLLVASPSVQARDDVRDAIDFAKRSVYPALVNISVVSQAFSGGRAQRFPGAGSGVIVSPAGHVLTNFHVAGDATQIHCTMPDGEVVEADVVAHDPLTDLSVLKMKLDQRTDQTKPLPFATLGDSDALEVGQIVLAMGNPLTLSSSLTEGVVSNPNRVFTDFTGTDIDSLDLGEGQMTGIFTRWIQHDALILPGNSGGPLVDLDGRIVGINELGGNGVGFAIPSNLASNVLNQVMMHGEVRRGWVGCTVLPVSKIGRKTGALISSVIPSSPAGKAGLVAGDILLSIGDHETNVRFFEQVPLFYQNVAQLKAGSEVRIEYLRGDKPFTCSLTIAPMEKYLGEGDEIRDLGMTVREMTGPMALSRRLDSTEGVLVTGIRPGYPSSDAKPPVHRGDVIREVAGTPIPDLTTFLKEIKKAAKSSEFVIRIVRGEENVLTVIKSPEEKNKTRARDLPKAWLGVKTQVMTVPVARALDLEGTKGFRVTRVFPWTEAERAGLRTGDIILEVDGEELEAYRLQDAQDLKREIEDLPIGDEIDVVIHREGERKTLSVKLEATPQHGREKKPLEHKEFEFEVRDIVFRDRIEHRWNKDQEGVLVTQVTSGGWAHVAGLHRNDLITEVDGEPVTGIDGFESVMSTVMKRKPKSVRMFVRRGFRTHFVFIQPNWKRLSDDEG